MSRPADRFAIVRNADGTVLGTAPTRDAASRLVAEIDAELGDDAPAGVTIVDREPPPAA